MEEIKNDINKEQLINGLNENDDKTYKNNNENINLIKEESEENFKGVNNNILINSLFKAVEDNNLSEIENNLIKDNSDINTLNNNGLSLLHLSVIKGNIQMINKLLKYGANPNILSVPNKQTPLHLAYLSQESTRDNMINTLLSFNADNNIMDLYDNKPSDYNNIDNKNELNTPNKKNKVKKEDLYYKVNDININFFSTSDIKKKSSSKKKNNKNISKIKCNCIFTPKKNNNNNIDNIISQSSYNFSDLKNIDINFNSIDKYEDNNKNNNQNENINSIRANNNDNELIISNKKYKKKTECHKK